MTSPLTTALIALSLLAAAPRLKAQSWSSQKSSTTSEFIAVWSPDAYDAWAVGLGGVINKYNGSTWSAQASGITSNLYGVWGSSTSSVWAVGPGGTILHYNGSSWSTQTSPTIQDLNGIWGYSDTDVFAVGNSGTILHWNGTAWAAQTSGTTQTLIAVSGFDASNVWAAGFSGTILKWNGTTWQAQASGTTDYLSGVYAADATDVWACGNGGKMHMFNGTTWAPQTTGVTSDLRGMWGRTASNVWACANGGGMLYWNGTAWASQTTKTTADLAGMSGNGAGDLWAAGTGGTIVHFTPAPSSLFAYSFTFNPPGCATVQYSVGTARGTVTDANFTGSQVVKLPAQYVSFTFLPCPGYTLSTISSPQLHPSLLQSTAAGGPTIDPINIYTPTFGFFVNNARTLAMVYSGQAAQPTGGFTLSSPPEGKATPVSSATGNFHSIYGMRRFDFDVATDETGKITGMGTVDGMTTVTPSNPPTTSPDLNVGGSMATVSGTPTGSFTGAFSGTMSTIAAKGSMSTTVPFVPASTLTTKVSGSGTAGKTTTSVANLQVPLPAPVGGGQRSWSFVLTIVARTAAKGNGYKAAICTLTLPTGDKILFPEKPTSFAAKTGYSITCNYGIPLDSNGNPVLVLSSTGVLNTVAKTSLTFTGLKFVQSGNGWTPIAGTVKYSFMGQSGTANVVDFGSH